MIRAFICTLFLTLGAFAQQAPATGAAPPAAGAAPPAGTSEEALRARVAEFFQDFVDGKFRAADALVADDSKEVFFAEEKIRYKFCSVGRIHIEPDGQKATAVTSCGTMWAFHGQRIPTTRPMTTNWKIQNGQWFWYAVAFDGQVKTPFGKMKVDPNGEHQSPIPSDPGAMVPGMLSGVRANKTSVTIDPSQPAHEEVEITNALQGSVRLSLIQHQIPGLKIELPTPLVGARQKSVVTFDYTPEKGRVVQNTSVKVAVAPLQQMIVIHIQFAPPTTAKN